MQMTRRVRLLDLAHARSGDKGDTANVGVIALRAEFYPVLVEQLTTERVKRHFEGICLGEVERFELPNLEAINFLLHNSLGGGGTVSLKTDAQGKTLSTAMLRMEVEVPDEIAELADPDAPMNGPTASLLRRDHAGVAYLTLNRPERRNALDGELVTALTEQLRNAGADPTVRVVSIRGEGPDFCSGADLSAIRRMAGATVLDNLEDVDAMADLFLLIRALPKPVVALVHGRALAGGCGLATACDLVVAAEGASFGYPEVKIGFVPAMVMAILRRNVSEKRAFELIVGGATVSATEAERVGLINRVLPDDGFQQGGEEFLAELAGRSASAVMLCKRLLYHQDSLGFDAAIRAGADLNVVARMTEDTQAGIERFLSRAERGRG